MNIKFLSELYTVLVQLQCSLKNEYNLNKFSQLMIKFFTKNKFDQANSVVKTA